MNLNLRPASKLVLAGTLSLLMIFIAGCSNSEPESSTASAPPPSATDKQKIDEKVQRDSQIIESLKNKK
ncbi:hypothetical protein [Abditibacterium utsteinense]|nr:hypothetical protein [Abditibacterium utsteinense]